MRWDQGRADKVPRTAASFEAVGGHNPSQPGAARLFELTNHAAPLTTV